LEANQKSNKFKKLRSILTILIIFILVGTTGYSVYLWQQEKSQITKYQQAASITKQFAETVQNEVYKQFKLVDQRGHLTSSMTCGEIVASNNYQKTKPEYVRLVNNGVCAPFSDVYKPNYSAFTPKLQEKAKEINTIFSELGNDSIPDFKNKDTKNYLFDTCNGLIEVGQCDISTTF